MLSLRHLQTKTAIMISCEKQWSSFGFLHYKVVKSYVSEQYTASIFRVNEFVQVNADVIQRNKCVSYI